MMSEEGWRGRREFRPGRRCRPPPSHQRRACQVKVSIIGTAILEGILLGSLLSSLGRMVIEGESLLIIVRNLGLELGDFLLIIIGGDLDGLLRGSGALSSTDRFLRSSDTGSGNTGGRVLETGDVAVLAEFLDVLAERRLASGRHGNEMQRAMVLDGVIGVAVSFGSHLLGNIGNDSLARLELIHQTEKKVFMGSSIPATGNFARHNDRRDDDIDRGCRQRLG